MKLITYVLSKLGVKCFHLPTTPKATTFFLRLNEAEEVTAATVGLCDHPYITRDGDTRYKVDALTVWIAPYLFVIGLGKQPK